VQRLNPHVPAAAQEQAHRSVLLQPRGAMSLVQANREMDGLLRDGVAVEFEATAGARRRPACVTERVADRLGRAVTRQKNATNYLAVSQLWLRGERGWRRPDVLLYVNGLPLVFIELKNSNVALKAAYDDNLTNYKDELPQLFRRQCACACCPTASRPGWAA
jgi:type I restriction enzyme R subunit